MLSAPKPPSEKYGLEGYRIYLEAYQVYVLAYQETGKVTAKVEKARLYSDVTKTPEKATKLNKLAAKGKSAAKTVGQPEVSAKGTTRKSVPGDAAKLPAGARGTHAQNLRKQRRKLAAKLAEEVVSKRFPDWEDPRIPDELVRATRQLWQKSRLVPGNTLPHVFAALKPGKNADHAVRFVTSLTIERVAAGGLTDKKGELILPRNVPPVASTESQVVRAERPGPPLPPRR